LPRVPGLIFLKLGHFFEMFGLPTCLHTVVLEFQSVDLMMKSRKYLWCFAPFKYSFELRKWTTKYRGNEAINNDFQNLLICT